MEQIKFKVLLDQHVLEHMSVRSRTTPLWRKRQANIHAFLTDANLLDMPIHALTPSHVVSMLNYLKTNVLDKQGRPMHAREAYHHLGIIRRTIHMAMLFGLLNENPLRGFKAGSSDLERMGFSPCPTAARTRPALVQLETPQTC